MKHFFLLFFTALLMGLPLNAEPIKARDALSQLPDSIIPYLTKNNRLDLIDFMDSGMRARVQNSFEGYTELLALADDSLTLRLTEASVLKLYVISVGQEIDGSNQILLLSFHVGVPEEKKDIVNRYYSIMWRPLDENERKFLTE
jgi:hypothetical protein